MNYLVIVVCIVHVVSTCMATKILYVLPDNVSDVNCPSQPCTTLDQYLLDNGSLPVLSDVEYYFLPGEHHVNNTIDIVNAINFSLIESSFSPAKLVCQAQSYVGIFYSYNVTIRNLVFNQCSGDLYYWLNQDVTAALFLCECACCIVEYVHFFGYGFVGINLVSNSYLNNVTIVMTAVELMCSPKFLLIFLSEKYDSTHDIIIINQLSISGYNEICYELHKAMEIRLNESYGMHIQLYNSQFYNMDQTALFIRMEYTDALLLIRNCTFANIKHKTRMIDQVVYGEIATVNVTIKFEECVFYNNVALIILELQLPFYEYLCAHQTNITIENCDFRDSNSSSLIFDNDVSSCKPNIFFNKIVNLAKNIAHFMMYFSNVVVNMNGTINVSENNVTLDVMKFEYSDITFSNEITFLSNNCTNVILLMSYPLSHIKLMEYANIALINNTYRQLLDATGPIINNYDNIFPYCVFQYSLKLENNKYNISQLLTLYIINFSGNKKVEHTSTFNFALEVNNFHDFLTHCQWLPTAVFINYSSGYINQQIIQVDGHPWVHHKTICYCPRDGHYNCTVDLLGPVYPGQTFEVDLCMPQVDKKHIIYAVTHGNSLPKSACRIAHKTERLVINIWNHSETVNFTFVSEIKLCTLSLIAQPFARSAFYVQLSPCPVGFTLQNGKCDCDPFLSPDIDTCYIDLSAITRPANTWITAHTLTNNTTNYLISDCPMDYCLPYSTNVNLLYPDLQCQFNRTGILCSQCQHSLSMVFASSRCMKCTNVHILITIIVIVAGIVLIMLLYVLNLTVTKGTINGIIFYANIVRINDSVFLVNDNVFKSLRVFISFTNLDLGIETCFYDGMDSYAKMWLQLFFPSYLIIIAVSIIIASRYSSRILRLTYSRSLPVLATLFLLSYTGVLRVVLTVLFSYSTITEYPSGDKETVWSVDASVPLFGLRFTILFITCLVLFLLLLLFCITLIFTRFLSRFRVINFFKPLLDTFHHSYKNKFYYWVALSIIFRCMFFSMYAFQRKLRVFLTTTILVMITACYGYICPSKSKAVNIQNLSLLVNLTILYAVPLLDSEEAFLIIANFLISLTFVQFCITVLYHFVTYTFHWNVIEKKLKQCSLQRKLHFK